MVVANAPESFGSPPSLPHQPLDLHRRFGALLFIRRTLREEKNPGSLFLGVEVRDSGGSQDLELPDLDSYSELITQGIGSQQSSALEAEHCLPARRWRGEKRDDSSSLMVLN